MTKLNINYWASKTDDLNDVDVAAITDAFCSGTENGKGFTNDEKVLIAETMLANGKVVKNEKSAVELMTIAEKFNKWFAVEPLLIIDGNGRIKLWRYNYRKLVKAIPDTYVHQAIENIYKRLGFDDLSDNDIIKIGSSSSVYDVFLQSLNEEACGRYIFCDEKSDPGSYVNACYLNMWLLFGKLGLLGRSAFEVLAEVGELSVSNFRFYAPNPMLKGMIEEAADRSRGRTYPTAYEFETVVNL